MKPTKKTKNEGIEIKKENEIISLRHSKVGSIKHYISLNSNGGDVRCTFYTSEYMRETCRPSLNVAATYEEIEHLRDVFSEILLLMKNNMPKIIKAKIEKHPSGKEGFLITTKEGKKISVLNFADVMKSAAQCIKDCVYMSWEAWDGEESFRADTFEKVEKLLKKKYVLDY